MCKVRQLSIRNIITIVVVILWVVLGLGIALLSLLSSDDKPWQSLTAIGTWVLAGGIFFALWQLYEAEKSRNAQLAMSWLKEFRQTSRINTLKYIYGYKTPMSFEYVEGVIGDDNKTDIYYVLDQLDYLAFLVEYKIVDERLAIEGFAGATALRCWYQLHDYIRTKRKDRGVNLYEHIEDFAARVLHYAEEKHRDEDWITLKSDDTANDFRDLVRFFSNPVNQISKPKPTNLQPRTIDEVKSLHKEWQRIAPQIFINNSV